MSHEKRIIGKGRIVVARFALALFLFGLALPVTMSLLGHPMYSEPRFLQGVAFLTPSSELLALVFGFLGRHHLSGRVALIGALCALVLVALVPVIC
jgi:hypothetical protein